MMGILRTTLVLGAIIAFMPSPPAQPGADQNVAARNPGSFGYMAAAVDAVADVKGFCQRKPGVCDTAGYLASTLEAKAKYSAKLIYEWANEATEADNRTALPVDLALADTMNTGSVAPISSLQPNEILPAWKWPLPHHPDI